jgi:hypothetical protein
MVAYTVINGTEADLLNVNVGGVDVGSLSYRDGVTLTDAELAALCVLKGVAVIKDQTGAVDAKAIKRVIAIASTYANTLP